MALSFGLMTEWLKRDLNKKMRALIIIWTHYHINIIFEPPYKTLWFFCLFGKHKIPKKPIKPNKTLVLLKKTQWVGFFIKNPGFFQPCKKWIFLLSTKLRSISQKSEPYEDIHPSWNGAKRNGSCILHTNQLFNSQQCHNKKSSFSRKTSKKMTVVTWGPSPPY